MDEESLNIQNTSSVTLRVPPSPTGEGYSILPLILQTYRTRLFDFEQDTEIDQTVKYSKALRYPSKPRPQMVCFATRET